MKGASYVGHYKGAAVTIEAVSFKVSANGRKVIDLSVETPFKCAGGCGGVGSPTGGSARITRQGTFEVKLRIPAPDLPAKARDRHRDGNVPRAREGQRNGHVALQRRQRRRYEELDRDRLRARACARRAPAASRIATALRGGP